jgi:hypothetical protein
MILDSSDGCGIQVAPPAPRMNQFFADKVLEVQWLQEQHDRYFHHEIHTLPLAQKLTHFVLHMGKYGGNLMELHQADNLREFRRKVVDAVIIAMSMANTLQINLGGYVAETLKEHSDNVNVGNMASYMYRHKCNMAVGKMPSQFDGLIHFISAVGDMSSAITDYEDGLGSSPRMCLTTAVVDAFHWALFLYSSSQQAAESLMPIHSSIMNRLVQVEKKNMFYRFLPSRASFYNSPNGLSPHES